MLVLRITIGILPYYWLKNNLKISTCPFSNIGKYLSATSEKAEIRIELELWSVKTNPKTRNFPLALVNSLIWGSFELTIPQIFHLKNFFIKFFLN